jgi:hypothetical protein
MVDITTQEMKDLLLKLGDRLNNTEGDTNTVSKLHDIKLILERMEKLQIKNNPRVYADLISKAIADAFNRQGPPNQLRNVASPNFDIVDQGVVRSRAALVRELETLTASFRSARVQFGQGGFAQRRSLLPDLSNAGEAGKQLGELSANAVRLKSAMALGAAGITAATAIISGLTPLVNEQYDMYHQLSKYGQTFGGDMFAMTRAVAGARIPLDVMTNAMQHGTVALRQLGADGAANATRQLMISMRAVHNLGMSTEETVENLGVFAEQVKYQGGLDRIRNSSLDQTFQTMIKDTTTYSAAWGRSVEEIRRAAADIARDPRQHAWMAALAPEQRIRLTGIQAALPEGMRQDFASVQKYLATGRVDERASNVMRNAPQLFAAYQRIAHAQSITAQNVTNLVEIAGRQSQSQMQAGGLMPVIADAQDRASELARDLFVSLDEAAATRTNNAGEGLANQRALTGAITDYRNAMDAAKAAMQYGVQSIVAGAQETAAVIMEKEVDFINNHYAQFIDTMDGITRHMTEYDKKVAAFVNSMSPGAVVAGHEAASMLSTAAQYGIEGLGVVGAWAGAKRAAGLVRNVVTGGRVAGTTAGAAPGVLGGAAGAATGLTVAGGTATGTMSRAARLARGGRFLKRFLPTPLLFMIEGITTYSEIQEAAADLADGRITQAQFQTQVAESVGKAAGGIGGALLGLQLGAMGGGAVGSVVPGVGTGIGAVVGGIGGSIAGGFGGEAVGSRAADLIAGYLPSSPQPTLPQVGQSPTPSTQANGASPTPANGAVAPDADAPRPVVADPLAQLVDVMTRFSDEFHQQNLMLGQYQQDMKGIFIAIEENTESLNRNARRDPSVVR